MGTNPLHLIEGLDALKVLALVNRIGGRENVDAILAGSKKATLEDVIRLLIGKNVRFVIPEGFEFGHVDLNPNYYWEQPTSTFDFDAIVKRGTRFLPKGMKLPSTAQMEDACRILEEQIMADQLVSNLFTVKDPRRGIRLPWFLPQMDMDIRNVGKVIHELFKPAIKAAYEGVPHFKGRKFCDYRENDTDGQVTIVDESQLRLVSALREGPVFGWIFPAVFQGIGIEGDRALMKTLPTKHNFVLGGFDSLMATILHTEVLCRDGNTPGQDIASFQWRYSGCSLYLYAHGGQLYFGHRSLHAYEYCSAALSVFRQ